MMPATNHGVGGNFGFPDVCNTVVGPATAPIPYPNLGMDSMGLPFSPNVYVSGLPGHNQVSAPLITNGDEAGCVHSSFIGTGGSTFSNPLIHTSGMPSEHLCTLSQGNRYNCPLDAKLIPSITNVFYSFRCEGWSAAARELATGDWPSLAAGLDSAGRVAHLRGSARAAGLERGDRVLGQEGQRVFVARGERELELRLPAGAREDLELSWEGSEATLTLCRFLPQLADSLEEALARVLSEGARRLTLDLRGSPGGDLRLALDFAARFLPRGQRLLRLELAGRRLELSGSSRATCELPLRILVDADTASAGEALCLALNGRASLEGGPTFGKRHGFLLSRGRGGIVPLPFRFGYPPHHSPPLVSRGGDGDLALLRCRVVIDRG